MPRPDRSAAVAAFMKDYERLYLMQLELFQAGDVLVAPSQRKISILPENQGDLDIDVLRADESGNGWGGVVLTLITALADRHGLELYVRAHANDESQHPDAISQGELESFYSGHSFIDVGSWGARDMIRRPCGPPFAGPASEAQLLLLRAYQGEAIWSKPAAPSI